MQDDAVGGERLGKPLPQVLVEATQRQRLAVTLDLNTTNNSVETSLGGL